MIGNKLEQDIVHLYDSNLVNLFSINQISQKLGKRYPYINKKVSMMLKSGIMNRIVVGRSHLCSLNLDNYRTLLLLSMNELNKKKPAVAGEVMAFAEKNSLSTTLLSVVYYKNTLLFVVDDLRDRRTIQRSFPKAVVVDKPALLDMLSTDSELFRNHKVLYGFENFFTLLRLELDEIKRLYSPLKY
ncbi:hypothetical protein JXB31_04440 [Candidatus Woesearchaeota archaeon]|nr:hypothetical protein [Candidatus Woesearchaeota archaeon]